MGKGDLSTGLEVDHAHTHHPLGDGRQALELPGEPLEGRVVLGSDLGGGLGRGPGRGQEEE
jgi:hypothetical protein